MFSLDLTLSPPSAISKNQSQMDSSSTPNVPDNNNDFEGNEEQEFPTPDSRGKSKQVVSPDSRGKRKESPEASGATFQAENVAPLFTDWKAIERLGRFLVIFYNSTLVVSASTALNAYKCYGEIVTIAANLMDLMKSRDHQLKVKAEEMYQKFDKYWDGLKNINKMLIVATVFDPMKKMDLASMCFEELYGPDSLEGKEMYDSVISVLRSMFKEYSERFGKTQEEQSDQSKKSKAQGSRSAEQEASVRMDLVEDGIGYKRIDRRYKQKLNAGVRDRCDELEIYLKEAVENPELMVGVEYDVLSYWKRNSMKFPILSLMAKDVLECKSPLLHPRVLSAQVEGSLSHLGAALLTSWSRC